MSDLESLVEHLERTSRLSRPEALRLVEDVIEFLSESVEDFVTRRHRELRAESCSNERIFERIAEELARRRFRAPDLTQRQIRRLIYG